MSFFKVFGGTHVFKKFYRKRTRAVTCNDFSQKIEISLKEVQRFLKILRKVEVRLTELYKKNEKEHVIGALNKTEILPPQTYQDKNIISNQNVFQKNLFTCRICTICSTFG